MGTLAWRNLWRHRRRSLITAGAMALGAGFCMSVMSYTDGMYVEMARLMVDGQLGHAQVHHPDYPKKHQLQDTIPAALLADATDWDQVRAATLRLYGNALVASDDHTTGAQLIGVDPSAEEAFTHGADHLQTGAWLAEAPDHEVVLGAKLADKLGAGLGDELVVVTQASDGSLGNDLYTIKGTVMTGQTAMDRSGVWIHISDLQDLLVLPDAAHELLVQSKRGYTDAAAFTEEYKGRLGEQPDLLVQSWQEASPPTDQMFQMSAATKGVMLVFVFGLAAFGVVNTMVMSVFERTRELGVAIAVGMRPRQVVRMILLESVMLGVLAAGAGGLFGGLLDGLLVHYGLPMSTDSGGALSMGGVTFGDRLYGVINPADIVMVLVSVVVVSALASLWPAWRASRLRPVDAMRQE